MKYTKSLIAGAVLSLAISVGIKSFNNRQENTRRTAVVEQACRLVEARAQVGSLRDVYDQAFSVLRLYTQNPESFVTLKDGGIAYELNKSKASSKSSHSLFCTVEGKPDLQIGFHFPPPRLLDRKLAALWSGAFFCLVLLYLAVRWSFSRAVWIAHREFSQALADTFELDAPPKKQSIIARFLSSVLIPRSSVIARVKGELLDQKEKLESATQVQREMLAIIDQKRVVEEKYETLVDSVRRIRHDLRSPIAYLHNHGVMLVEEEQKAADIYNVSLNRVDACFRELDGKIGVKLNEAKETTLQIAECLLHDSITAKKAFWGLKKGVTVGFDFDRQNLSPIEVVPEHFVRAFENLLQNAYEAVGDDGLIQVVCRRSGDSSVLIQVKDNGRGIHPSILSRLGLEEITFGKRTGNGIGLRSARSWIEKWGGQLSIHSEEGQGTSVIIRLPLQETKTRFIAELPRGSAVSGIAVVDDEPELGQALLAKSNAAGNIFTSITAYARWLEEGKSVDSCLHVFDLHLKNGSGLDLLQILPWPERAVLYTNDYLNDRALEATAELGVPILPKCFV